MTDTAEDTPEATESRPAENTPNIDMTGWSDADKTAFAAARLAAEEEERELADERLEFEGSPAQQAIDAERKRAEKARKERERIKRETVEKNVRADLKKQYSDNVIFYPTKGGMVAIRVPSEKESVANATRVKELKRDADKIATFKETIRDVVLYPSKAKFDEIAARHPCIYKELSDEIDEHTTARDYTARPYD